MARGIRLNGTDKNDILNGTANDDYISGGKGDDVISDGAGRDIVLLGEGADRYIAGAGSDTVYDTPDRADSIDIALYRELGKRKKTIPVSGID